MDLGLVAIFWGGMVILFLVAALLSDLDVDRMRARTTRREIAVKGTSPTAPSGWRLVHTARRGCETVMVWSIEGRTHGDARHALTVERTNSQCRDCMSCVNDAIHWMQQQGHLGRA
jgi:hypothetical protein